ncbi:MAG: DUF2179 domain-containing protein [Calditrichae bacterium]|nr:DUF2179 domain-containing protein [Calditrichota bacterium]MCB9057401.1 DUF2179 domain-containing protein [Calditrichia bacterium]
MFYDTTLFNWVILPLLIFCARVVDVSLGTMRIISLSRDLRKIAPLLGFLEILIWLIAIRQIFNNLNNPACYIAYAGGFATGIYTGMGIERRLAIGLRVVRIITRFDSSILIATLREKGFGVTTIDAEGSTGAVKIIFTMVKRRDVHDVTALINEHNPNAFFTVEDIRSAKEGTFPVNGNNRSDFWSLFMNYEKKAK